MKYGCLVLGCCIAVAGCGSDGGSGTGGSAASPTSAAPTPSPTPATAGSPTLLTLAADQNLEGFSGSNGYNRDDSGGVAEVENYSNAAGYPVSYSASTRLFSFSSFQSILPNGLSSSGATLHYDASASLPGYYAYAGQSAGVSYTLLQLYPGTSNPTLGLVYTSLAVAKASYHDASRAVTDYGVTPIAFGLPFNYGAGHLSGTGTYAGVILAQARGQGSTHAYDIRGEAGFQVNFDSTAFSGTLHLVATDDRSGQVFDLGTITLSHVTPRGVLDYLYANTTVATTMYDTFQGRLNGPGGEELMAGFDAHLPDPQAPSVLMKVSGAVAARK